MDHSLNHNSLGTSVGRNLLYLSAAFEPYVPGSHQDVLETLKLLGGLAEVAQHSLKPPPEKAKPQNALSRHPPRSPGDQALLDALERLRQSGTLQRRSPGMFATIVRNPVRPQHP